MKSDAIIVTENAKFYINERLYNDKLLLIKMNNKGCSGHSIEYDLIDPNNIKKYDEVIRWQNGGLVIEAMSVMGLLGSMLDVDSTIAESYLVWKNPNAINQCGCGSSFELVGCKTT